MLTHNDFSSSPYGQLWSSNPSTTYTPGFGQSANGASSFFQTDWLGSTRYVTDSTGSTVTAAQSYDAWGSRDWQAPGSPSNPTDFQFAGAWGYQTEWSDGPSTPGLGLDYLQQRYYDPGVGRFMAPDPAGFAGGGKPRNQQHLDFNAWLPHQLPCPARPRGAPPPSCASQGCGTAL